VEANNVSLKTFAAATASILFIEALIRLIPAGNALNSMATLAVVRCLEGGLLVFIAILLEKDPGRIGLAPARIPAGLRKGLIWSAGFGIVVGIVYILLLAAGINVLQVFIASQKLSRQQTVIFFVVGGVIGPIAEEIFFRGIVYGFFRRWGAPVAVIASTLLFVLIHPYGTNLPVAQTVGGLVFAVAYEREKSLVVPITIHSLGNLAIFSLALLG